VVPVVLPDGTPAVLKLWNGNPTVQLLDADKEHSAMLLERWEPGTALRALPELEHKHCCTLSSKTMSFSRKHLAATRGGLFLSSLASSSILLHVNAI